MKTKTFQLTLFFVWFYLLFCTACQPASMDIALFTITPTQSTSATVTVTQKIILSPTSTPTIGLLPTIQFFPTSTETLHPGPTNTPSPLPTSTLIPLPTLAPNEAEMEIQRLYETNNGCLLPCWWGITPDTTNWGNARHFLAQLAPIISERINSNFKGIISIEVNLSTGGSPHRYIVDNGVVIKMEGYIQMTPLFDPTTILATYGPPTEIRFFFVRGGPYLELILFYPEHGFLLQYETRNGNTGLVNGFQRGCIRPNGVTYIVVWSPAETFTLSERLSQTSHFRTDPNPGPPIEETLGMSIETFYQTFRNAEPPMCLETPDDLWVGR